MDLKKLTYSIGQVAELADVPQSTIRYWETVIDALNPTKTEGGSRRYSQDDIEILLKIKALLYNEGRTIKGANKYFLSKNNKSGSSLESKQPLRQSGTSDRVNPALLKQIMEELMEIRELLNGIRD